MIKPLRDCTLITDNNLLRIMNGGICIEAWFLNDKEMHAVEQAETLEEVRGAIKDGIRSEII